MPEMAAELPPADESREGLTAMSFLDHLEELRRRLIYSIIAVAVGFFACWKYHEFIFGYVQRPIMDALHRNGMAGKAGLSEPHRTLQPLLEGCGPGWPVRDLADRSLPGLDVHLARPLPQRKAVRIPLHVLDRHCCFWQADMFGYKMVYPAALDIPDRLRQTVPADDHDRRVYRPVPDHHSGHGCDFRAADPGLFSVADGNRDCRAGCGETSAIRFL